MRGVGFDRFEKKNPTVTHKLNSGIRLSHLHLQGFPLLKELPVLSWKNCGQV